MTQQYAMFDRAFPGTTEAKKIGGEGMLTPKDLEDFHAASRRVYEAMKDGRWLTRDQIEDAAGTKGVPAREGMRRMRELRKHFVIEKKRISESREWCYRLVR